VIRFGTVFKQSAKSWYRENSLEKGAALAYFAVFSIAPLLVLITFLVGLFHVGDTMEQVRIQFKDFVSPAAADVIALGVVNASLMRGGGLPYTIFAVLMTAVGASAFTYELQRAVDDIWKVDRHGGKRLAVLRRLWTLVLGVAMGVLLQISVLLNARTSVFRENVDALLPGVCVLWHWVDNSISVVIIAVIYFLSYTLLPTVKVKWKDAAAGAVVSTVLFIPGRWIVALYVLPGSFSSVYGAAGSLMLLLTWLYYCALVFLFGGRFAKACEEDRGFRELNS